ncbi:MAG TPA: MFS transporter [Labilithrix sp.]|nr:MFS transporter [Labilithrix sp.]
MHRRVELLLLTAGWGANHFATLLLVYRRQLGFAPADLGLLFGAYALGLVPGLLLAGRVSDARGRRAIVLPAAVIALAASVTLAFGGHGFGVLFAGRLLYGLAMGSVMSPGSVWVTELSSAESGPRRATLALSAGFGLGPLVAAGIAEAAPAPMVLPYVVHVAVMAVALVRARSVPETAGAGAAVIRPATRGPRVRDMGVLVELLPVAPWAFGFAAVTVAILPGIMREHVARPVLFSGFVIVTTLLTGVAVQPLTTRLGPRGDRVGLALGAAGIGLGAHAARIGSPALVFVVAVLVGGGYGLVMTTGLREVQRRVHDGARGTAVGIYYVLTYVGFALPFVHATVARSIGDVAMLTLTAVAAVASLVVRTVFTMSSARRRSLLRVLRYLTALLAVAVLGALADGWHAIGKRATGERLARMERSPEWKDGRFVNPQPLRNDAWVALQGALHVSEDVSPKGPVPTAATDPAMFAAPPPSGLRVTWLGHSTMIVEIDGHRVLTDPVWGSRVGPFEWTGPRPWFAPPIALEELPTIDAVLISHDHYDHLDHRTIERMRDWNTTFIVPLGVGAHLVYFGIPESRIVELDWWEHIAIGALTITSTPARHASGRALVDDDSKLWTGFALVGPKHRVYYSGDTGLFPAMHDIGARLGPFDLTMIEVGQYHGAWPDWHIGPEQAVIAHQWVGGRVMLPVHWGKIALAYHAWTEPIERVTRAAAARQVTLVAPKPGQSFEPSSPPAIERWWPDVPWKTAEEEPVRSSQIE